MSTTTKHRMGAKVTVAEYQGAVPEGKRFIAWSTRPDGTGTVYKPGQTITLAGDVHLYPVLGDAVEQVPEKTEGA